MDDGLGRQSSKHTFANPTVANGCLGNLVEGVVRLARIRHGVTDLRAGGGAAGRLGLLRDRLVVAEQVEIERKLQSCLSYSSFHALKPDAY